MVLEGNGLHGAAYPASAPRGGKASSGDYDPPSLRRRTMPSPIKPVPSRSTVPGSGTGARWPSMMSLPHVAEAKWTSSPAVDRSLQNVGSGSKVAVAISSPPEEQRPLTGLSPFAHATATVPGDPRAV